MDCMCAAQVLQELFVIHNSATLSNVALRRNIIRSAALCDGVRMEEIDLESEGGRLAHARRQAGFDDAAAFAKRAKIKPVTYRAYENNQNRYLKHVHTFADLLGVPAKWLIEGGELERDTDALPEGEIEAQARSMGLSLIPELELGYSMGGGSIFTDYRQTGFVPFHRDWLRGFMKGSFADLFVARGSGDSMTPTLMDGDIVLIDTAQKRIDQQDRIWALSYGDLGMIKRVRRLPGGTYRIMSDNPNVAPIDANDDELYVVGRVTWVGRTM